jgi:hypothetical protein
MPPDRLRDMTSVTANPVAALQHANHQRSFSTRPVGSGSVWSQACHFSNVQSEVRAVGDPDGLMFWVVAHQAHDRRPFEMEGRATGVAPKSAYWNQCRPGGAVLRRHGRPAPQQGRRHPRSTGGYGHVTHPSRTPAPSPPTHRRRTAHIRRRVRRRSARGLIVRLTAPRRGTRVEA